MTVEGLIKILEEHKDADRIVTDVGSSMFSGWGSLKRVDVHLPDRNMREKIIELIFS